MWVRALYDYAAQEPDELELHKGDLILVASRDDDWWRGSLGSRSGEFPSNYVEVIDEEDVVRRPEGTKKQASLREMRAALAATEKEQEDLAQEAKLLRETEITPPEEDVPLDDAVQAEAAARQAREAEQERREAELREQQEAELRELQAAAQREQQAREAALRDEQARAKALREAALRDEQARQAAAAAWREDQQARVAAAAARERELQQQQQQQDFKKHEVRDHGEQVAISQADTSQQADMMQADTTSHDLEAKAELIAKMVESRLRSELERREARLQAVTRDAVVDQVKEAMAQLRAELLPMRSSRSENHTIEKRGKTTKLPPVQRSAVDDGAGSPPKPASPKKKPKFDENLPRVATLDHGRQDKAKQAQLMRELAAKSAVRYAKCKTVVYAPDTYESPSLTSTLSLEHVYAYSGKGVGSNATWSIDGSKAVYPAAAVVVAHDIDKNKQAFFEGHAGEAVTAVARHPFQDVFATGQAGKRPRACVWTLGGDPIADLHMPTGSRLISLLRFSPCGHVLLTLVAEGNAFTIWDWATATPLASRRVGTNPVYGAAFHPTLAALATKNSFEDAVDAQYAFATCGYRSIKFWTLTLEDDDDAPPSKSPHPKKWRCEGNAATGRGDILLHALTALSAVVVESAQQHQSPRSADEPSFVPDACYVVGTETGTLALWQQAEEDDHLGWLPRGRCLAALKSSDQAAVLDLAVCHGIGARKPPRVVSACRDGHVRIFLVMATKKPLSLVGDINMASAAPLLGAPRSLSLDTTESKVLIGTTSNALAVMDLPALQPIDNDDLKAAFLEHVRSATTDQLSVTIFAHGHAGSVHAVAAHPTSPVVASVGADKSLRFWDTQQRKLTQLLRLPGRGLSVAFDVSGDTVAVGCDTGDLVLVSGGRITHKRRVNNSGASSKPATSPQLKHGSVDEDDEATETTILQHKVAVTAVAFSPDASKLAVACADRCIHVFGDTYRKRLAVLKGHANVPLKVDFDATSTKLQSSDAGRDLLFWDLAKNKQIANAFALRNATWSTHSCTIGWAVSGVLHDQPQQDAKAVARAHSQGVLVAPGPRNTIRLSSFPTLPGDTTPSKSFHCHSKPVAALAFASDDATCYSAAGPDATLAQWEHHH